MLRILFCVCALHVTVRKSSFHAGGTAALDGAVGRAWRVFRFGLWVVLGRLCVLHVDGTGARRCVVLFVGPLSSPGAGLTLKRSNGSKNRRAAPWQNISFGLAVPLVRLYWIIFWLQDRGYGVGWRTAKNPRGEDVWELDWDGRGCDASEGH